MEKKECCGEHTRCSDNARVFHPEMTFGHKFRMLHNSIAKIMDNRRANCEERLTGVQCATLRFLIDHQEQEIFQKDIESTFSITGATATNILKGMEKRGLIHRVAIEKDARLKRIILTDKAYEYNEGIRRDVLQMEATITKGMTQEEKTIFGDLLNRAILNVEEMRKSEEQ